MMPIYRCQYAYNLVAKGALLLEKSGRRCRKKTDNYKETEQAASNGMERVEGREPKLISS